VCVNSLLELNSALKAVVITVPACNTRLNWLAGAAAGACRHALNCLALAIFKDTLLLQRVNVVDNIKIHAKRAFFPPLLYVEILYLCVLQGVVICISIPPKHNRLANEVEYVASAAEAAIGGREVVHRGEFVNSGVVIIGVIKHKVAKFAAINAKGLQDFSYSVSYRLTSVGTHQLRQRDR
jgi:hypothetical protein